MTKELNKTQSYVYDLKVSDAGSPSKEAEIRMRVDTFVPEDVVVTINMSITLDEYNAKSEKFQELLKTSLASRYPGGVVKVWKILTRQVETTVATNRRKLLAYV